MTVVNSTIYNYIRIGGNINSVVKAPKLYQIWNKGPSIAGYDSAAKKDFTRERKSKKKKKKTFLASFAASELILLSDSKLVECACIQKECWGCVIN